MKPCISPWRSNLMRGDLRASISRHITFQLTFWESLSLHLCWMCPAMLGSLLLCSCCLSATEHIPLGESSPSKAIKLDSIYLKQFNSRQWGITAGLCRNGLRLLLFYFQSLTSYIVCTINPLEGYDREGFLISCRTHTFSFLVSCKAEVLSWNWVRGVCEQTEVNYNLWLSSRILIKKNITFRSYV